MFEFPALIVLIACLVMTVSYVVMLVPKFNLRLTVFIGVSAAFTVVQILLAVLVPSDWLYYGLIQCGLFDAGALAHLLNGKRTVQDVVGKK